MKIFFLLFFLWNSSYGYVTNSGIYLDDSDMSSPEVESKLTEMISKLDYDHFVDSFEIDFADWKTCGSENMGLPGIAGCYDEPIMMADFSKEPLKIQSLGISLSDDIAKSGYTRKSQSSSNMFGHVNFIKFFLLGMIIDSELLCLENGDIALAYMSDYDPLYDGMLTRQMFAGINSLMKPHLLLLGFVDCAAASIDNFTSPLSIANEYSSKIRMSSPHYFGCWNAFPMGGWSTQSDPIIGAATSIGFGLASHMRVGGLGKTVKIKGLDGSVLPDTMCGERLTTVFVKTQFLYQLIYPTASRTVPLGAAAPEWAEFKNTGESVDESAFWIWQRKCMYMGAAECPGS